MKDENGNERGRNTPGKRKECNLWRSLTSQKHWRLPEKGNLGHWGATGGAASGSVCRNLLMKLPGKARARGGTWRGTQILGAAATVREVSGPCSVGTAIPARLHALGSPNVPHTNATPNTPPVKTTQRPK